MDTEEPRHLAGHAAYADAIAAYLNTAQERLHGGGFRTLHFTTAYQPHDEFERRWLDAPRKSGLTTAMGGATATAMLIDEATWKEAWAPTVDGDALAADDTRGDAERERLRVGIVTVYDCDGICLAELTTPDGQTFYGFDGAMPPGSD